MAAGRKQYPFNLIEAKWQRLWDQHQTFRAWNPGESIPESHPFARRHGSSSLLVGAENAPPKYYILDMFPYPSGAGLHVGHPEGYTATDIVARYKRARGFNVLHPMGWDAFGLPAEQYAIKTGQHPRRTTEVNISTFKRQIKSLGFSYDWTREIDTTDPGYFKWTQWIFLKLYNSWFNPEKEKAQPIETLAYPEGCDAEESRRAFRDSKRLAYVADAAVNWCPELGTVLANEEVIDGKSEVGGFPVVRKPMRQWMLRITAFAERLLDDLESIDWSHSLKEMQRNWIGRSEGAEVGFKIAKSNRTLSVFTTRPDTLFGATYMVLAPEHKLVGELTAFDQRKAVEDYCAFAASRSDRERAEPTKEKTGVFTGALAINPVNEELIPIWIADYVLASYGTGSIMAVPAHDARDLDFAKKFQLPIRQVVQAPDGRDSIGFIGEGTSVNSSFLNGLPTLDSKCRIISWLEEAGCGSKTVNYKLRDWLFSRQRYWGEPFPIVWKDGHHQALPESALPLAPPELTDFKPTGAGEPPLARAKEWTQLPDGSTRETNTMPQWAGSCWYYLRYLDPDNDHRFCNPEIERYWMKGAAEANHGTSTSAPDLMRPAPGVDLYIGGAEHAVLHLLYARFWHKVLFDLGYLSTPEPFYKLINQGIILGEDNQKMSKARGNVVSPDEILDVYGADAFRLYEMFLGPLEMVKPWNTKGVEGVYRFLGRVWRLFVDERTETEFEQRLTMIDGPRAECLDEIRLNPAITASPPSAAQLKALQLCIQKVTEDLDHLHFNTAISAMMVFVNEAMTWEIKPADVMRQFLILLQPFAPHLAEELFSKLPQHEHGTASAPPDHSSRRAGAIDTMAYEPWPQFDPSLLVENVLEIPVQVNGRLRDRITVPANATSQFIEAAALTSEKVKAFIGEKTIQRIVVVPKKLVNIVVAGD